MKLTRRRWARRHLADMPHDEAAWTMRKLAREGCDDGWLMTRLSERALETSPPDLRYLYERWAATYRAGRRVRVSDFPVTFLEPVDPELALAVDQAFDEGEQ